MVTGRSADRLQAAAARIRGLETFASDIGSAEAREALAGHVSEVMPDLDTVVNNAGIQRRVPLASDDAPWSEARTEIEVLLDGPIHLNRLLVPVLLESGRSSLIVDVTSGGAYMPQTFAPVYSAAKAALHSYTVNLRWALADTSVRVSELIPPAVATALAGDRHGADVDEFCDAVFPKLDGAHDEIGFGFTASEDFQAYLDRGRELFHASANRAPVARYLPTGQAA